MAIKRLFQVNTFDPTALADTAAMTNALYMALAGTATTGVAVSEIYMGGQATASAVKIMQFARHSTVAITPTALAAPNADGPLLNMSTQPASGAVSFVAAATGPQRSAVITTAKLNLSMNAFGGIVRWMAQPGGEWLIAGVAVNLSESSLSNFTGGAAGAIGAHIAYENL
jgi:hypothetical protein